MHQFTGIYAWWYMEGVFSKHQWAEMVYVIHNLAVICLPYSL